MKNELYNCIIKLKKKDEAGIHLSFKIETHEDFDTYFSGKKSDVVDSFIVSLSGNDIHIYPTKDSNEDLKHIVKDIIKDHLLFMKLQSPKEIKFSSSYIVYNGSHIRL